MGILLDTSNPFWDPNIITLIEGIQKALPQQPLVTVAKQIAAALALIYIAFRAFAMISGDGKLEVMPLFRPFIINLVILNLGSFMTLLQFPGTQAETLLATSFDANAALINTLQDQKTILHDSLINKLYRAAEAMKAQEHTAHEDDTFTTLEDMTSDIGIDLTLYARLASVKTELMFQDLINIIAIGLFKGVAYCLFFISVIIMYILSVVGPISLAFSIGGAFKDSWIHWAGKVIAVSFYKAIGYIVLNISCAILDYGFQQEIDRLQQLMAETDDNFFYNAVLHTDYYLGYLFIAIVVAIAGIGCTPMISTWFISTQGGGDMAKSFRNAALSTITAPKKLIGK